MLLEVLLGGSNHLQGGDFVSVRGCMLAKLDLNDFPSVIRGKESVWVDSPTLLKAGDDGSNEATLWRSILVSVDILRKLVRWELQDIVKSHCSGKMQRTWTPSGLMAMNLRQTLSATVITTKKISSAPPLPQQEPDPQPLKGTEEEYSRSLVGHCELVWELNSR